MARMQNETARLLEQRRAAKRRWKERNKEKVAEGKRQYWQRKREGMSLQEWQAKIRKNNHGDRAASYETLFDKQQGRCACCSRHHADCPKGVLYLDHDHSTGKNRGLLCHQCNCALGYARDDPELLRTMAEYIENNSQQTNKAYVWSRWGDPLS